MNRFSLSRPIGVIAAVIVLGGLFTFAVSFQFVAVEDINADELNLSLDEEAYYEFVSPRLDRLVLEVSTTREMVETKSRDIVALTRAGSTIDTLTGEIRAYGEENGVPPTFEGVHARILSASDTVTHTFDEARTALRTFNFSGMSALVVGFTDASDQFIACQSDLAKLVE